MRIMFIHRLVASMDSRPCRIDVNAPAPAALCEGIVLRYDPKRRGSSDHKRHRDRQHDVDRSLGRAHVKTDVPILFRVVLQCRMAAKVLDDVRARIIAHENDAPRASARRCRKVANAALPMWHR